MLPPLTWREPLTLPPGYAQSPSLSPRPAWGEPPTLPPSFVQSPLVSPRPSWVQSGFVPPAAAPMPTNGGFNFSPRQAQSPFPVSGPLLTGSVCWHGSLQSPRQMMPNSARAAPSGPPAVVNGAVRELAAVVPAASNFQIHVQQPAAGVDHSSPMQSPQSCQSPASRNEERCGVCQTAFIGPGCSFCRICGRPRQGEPVRHPGSEPLEAIAA